MQAHETAVNSSIKDRPICVPCLRHRHGHTGIHRAATFRHPHHCSVCVHSRHAHLFSFFLYFSFLFLSFFSSFFLFLFFFSPFFLFFFSLSSFFILFAFLFFFFTFFPLFFIFSLSFFLLFFCFFQLFHFSTFQHSSTDSEGTPKRLRSVSGFIVDSSARPASCNGRAA